jgi:D-serine deaminase-like pyridoxal phosphate-dependent protein
MKLFEMETPCLVLEKGKLQRNIERMCTQVGQLGARLRPHLKTAKCIEVARMALATQSGGITVSTLKEADYFFEHGITDLLYAVGIASIKLDHVAELTKRGATLTIILDSLEQAQAAAHKAQMHGVTLPVMIEIDSDGHRSGVTPDDPLLVEIGRMLHQSEHLQLKGVLTHAGDSYGCKTIAEIQHFSAIEREGAVRCAENLRQAGLACPTVSVGSTPTATYAMDYADVTEVRAGVYMFYDLKMAGLDVCSIEDLALSVAASVIGHQRQKGWVITDAGWMALSSDRGTAKQKIDQGYGVVCDMEGRPYQGLIVVDAYQEHGIIAKRPGLGKELGWHNFPIGSMVRILPNHACATGAMHDRYHVVDGTAEVIGIWHRINGY